MHIRQRRRWCLRALATATAAALAVVTLQAQPATAATAYAHTLNSDKLNVGFGTDGSIQSLKINGDLYDTQYVMNPEVAPDQGGESNAKYKQWLGNVMFSYANGSGAVTENGVGTTPWKKAWTTQSADARTVTSDGNSVTVTYRNSGNAEGIQGFDFQQKYSIAPDGSLTWTQTATNTASSTLTIGDWGVPVPANELWRQGDQIYETRVLTHSAVSDDSSYLTMQRPSGQGPFLMLSTDSQTGSGFEYQDRWRTQEVGDTPWAWNSANEGSNIKGLNTYYVHSEAIQKTNRGYLERTNLQLAPGDSRSYTFHIAKVDDDQSVKDTLYAQGSLDTTVVPGMVVPYDQKAQIALRVKGIIDRVVGVNNNDLGGPAPTNPALRKARTNGQYEIWEASFDKTQLGTNDITVHYTSQDGRKHQSVLQFAVIDKVADLLDTHAQFMVDHTQWTGADGIDSSDMRFGTFDDWMMNAADGSLPSASEAPQGRRDSYAGYWGLGDDWGLPHGEFLAEKLVSLPEREQVQALDTYLEKAVWENLMGNTDDSAVPSYLVYDFWEQGKPGKQNTTPSYRGYAYAHVYNTFFSMYKVAKQNPELIDYSRSDTWYLETAYRIFKEMYDGPVTYNWDTGVMGELTTPDIIAALRAEGMNAEANDVEAKMARKFANFSANKYPYGSEYSYDNTGEEAVYTLAKVNIDEDRANSLRMMRDIVEKTTASRGQMPTWYYYANPVTITGENWWNFQYSIALAGYTMDDYINHTAALETGNNAVTPAERAQLQRLNYGAKLGGLSVINSGQISNDPRNIGASAWSYQAEKGNLGTLGVGGGENVELLNGWRGMTGESDLGLWGALQTLSADVVTDDPIFGTVGYGATVADSGASTVVTPTDGLQRTLNLVTQQLSVSLESDQYTKATVAKNNSSVSLQMRNVTGLAHTGSLDVTGLVDGSYSVAVNGVKQGTINKYTPASAAGDLQDPTSVNFSAPAGTSYTIALTPTTAPTNSAPKVNAGTDVTGIALGLDTVTLSGTVTDDNLGSPNGTLTAAWSTTTAPTGAKVAFSDATSVRPTVSMDKAGTYVFTLTGSDGALSATDTVSVTVDPLAPLPRNWVNYDFDATSGATVPDTTGNGNALALKGDAAVRAEGSSSVLRLDGSDAYAQLPVDILSRSQDVTISTWVKLDTIANYGRIWDFGSSTQKYMFLSPSMGDGRLGFAISTAGNGQETQIRTGYTVAPGTWTHIRVTLQKNASGDRTTGSIYVNGSRVGQNTDMALTAKDLGRTSSNYLGKSQFADPLLAGSFDDFRIDGAVTDTAPTATGVRITGTPAVGSVLTATAAAAPADSTLSYQWRRGATAIAGATKASYTATAADAGAALTVMVTATKFGYAGPATPSSAVTVTAAAPVTTTTTASSRCISGKVVLTSTVKNTSTVPVTVAIRSPYGEKSVADLGPGKTTTAAFTTRLKTMPAGQVVVTATANGSTASGQSTASYATRSC
ncbi:hypothetical protein ASF48_08990 [Rathayibacter sp. Leaf299]|uniref:DUF5695 domain-containing protein n=1 Tax=Rathayibacter sp. Leaf299 TaxID=1736328 RepID=UPI0006F5044C|nr:DUF5695 domain-containing protein [Rathayibacter sp. Leaf299]KQQ20725.1 hypothetical protein ASF48_08990 [Rathayibacter sp. Leaf299]